MTEHLPDELPEHTVQLPEKVHVRYEDSLQEHSDVDLHIANFTLDMLMVAWRNVRTITQACRLSQSTLQLLKDRRDICNKQYAAPRQTSMGNVVYPLD